MAVLHRGVLAFHGPARDLAHYFRVENLESLYARLEEREPEEGGLVAQACPATAEIYDAAYTVEGATPAAAGAEAEGFPPQPDVSYAPGRARCGDGSGSRAAGDPAGAAHRARADAGSASAAGGAVAGAFSQFSTLLARRFRIFFRSRGQLLLQLGLVLGFPFLVAIFAWNGLPQVQNLSTGIDLDAVQQLQEASQFLAQASKVGSLVSGIVMFQVILLTLMGANNSGREIAASGSSSRRRS